MAKSNQDRCKRSRGNRLSQRVEFSGKKSVYCNDLWTYCNGETRRDTDLSPQKKSLRVTIATGPQNRRISLLQQSIPPWQEPNATRDFPWLHPIATPIFRGSILLPRHLIPLY